MAESLEVRWYKDTQAEQALAKLDIAGVWEYVSIDDFQPIDARKGNTGRVETALIAELADEYASSMKQGDEFPGIIALRRRGPVPNLQNISGRHRFAAAVSCGAKRVYAYVVRADRYAEDKLATLPAHLNAINGKKEDVRDRVAQAIMLITKHNITTAKASELLKVPVTTINKHKKLRKVRDELAAIGFTKTFLDRDLMALEKFLPLASVFKAAAEVVGRGLDKDELDHLVGEINAARSEAAKVQAIEAWKAATAPRKRGIVTSAAPDKFLRYLRNAESVGNSQGWDVLTRSLRNKSADERKLAAQMAAALGQRLITIAATLNLEAE